MRDDFLIGFIQHSLVGWFFFYGGGLWALQLLFSVLLLVFSVYFTAMAMELVGWLMITYIP